MAVGRLVSFRISGLVNPPRAGTFDFVVRSKTSIPSERISGVSTDTGTFIRVLEEGLLPVTIEPAALEDTGVYPYPLSVGYRGVLRVRFRVANVSERHHPPQVFQWAGRTV
jgi:hypothetical protein